MAFKPLVLLLASAMVVSLFLPWIATPVGNRMVPWELVRQLSPNQAVDLLKGAPPEVWALVASFACAALLVVMCVLGIEGKLFALLTGAIPLGLVGYGDYEGTNAAGNLGLPQFNFHDWQQILDQIRHSFGPGLYAWLGGAAVLFVVSLFDPGRTAR